MLVVDTNNNEAAVYQKSGDGTLRKIDQFPMSNGKNTSGNFDKTKRGDKTTPLGIYALTRKDSNTF